MHSPLPSVAPKREHVRKKHVLIGCKDDMFCRQTFEVWSGGCCRLDLFSLIKILATFSNEDENEDVDWYDRLGPGTRTSISTSNDFDFVTNTHTRVSTVYFSVTFPTPNHFKWLGVGKVFKQ